MSPLSLFHKSAPSHSSSYTQEEYHPLPNFFTTPFLNPMDANDTIVDSNINLLINSIHPAENHHRLSNPALSVPSINSTPTPSLNSNSNSNYMHAPAILATPKSGPQTSNNVPLLSPFSSLSDANQNLYQNSYQNLNHNLNQNFNQNSHSHRPSMDFSKSPLSLPQFSSSFPNAPLNAESPFTPLSPYNYDTINNYTLSNNFANNLHLNNYKPNLHLHNRSASLPVNNVFTLSTLNTFPSISASPVKSNDFSSFNIHDFSLPSIRDNANDSVDTQSIEHQLSTLSIENSAAYPNTRRNTLFSNASISSVTTSNSNHTTNSATNSTTNSATNSKINSKTNANANSNPKRLPDVPQPQPKSLSCLPTTIDLPKLSSEEIINLSKDQNGCRKLQKLIDDDVSKNMPIIFNATYKNSTSLMMDPFGNYLIQKLMVHASPSQLSLIIIDISSSIDSIATNLHGTRALQKLIGCLTSENHHDLISRAIEPVVVPLVHDMNGNHVIQKLISHYFDEDLDFLVELVITHLLEISTHKHGCCVLQKLLNKCSNIQIEKISNEILSNSIYLMKDQFGNYVIQYLISLNIDSINIQLLNLVANDIIPLSCGKFSSNVVEKCLKLNPSNLQNSSAIHPLLASLINAHTLVSLIKNQYGNYVVQTALEISDWQIKCVMAEMIRPILPNIRYTNYGKRIYTKVVSILNELDKRRNDTGLLLPPINFNS